MKTILILATLLVALPAAAHAMTGAQLAEQKQCLQCHAMDKDTIGPSFRKMGATYRRTKNPQARLIEVMRLGSDAHLGPMQGKARMPDNSERPPISDREARQLARWILQAGT